MKNIKAKVVYVLAVGAIFSFSSSFIYPLIPIEINKYIMDFILGIIILIVTRMLRIKPWSLADAKSLIFYSQAVTSFENFAK